MIMRKLAVLPVAAALAVLAGPTAVADTTPVSSIDLAGGPGTFPVKAAVHWAEPDQEVLYSNNQGVKVVGDAGWDYTQVVLRGPDGEPLHVGTYTTVGDPQAHPESASILVVYDGFGCYAEEGDITVDRIEVDPATGLLTAFDGSFDQRCPGTATSMHGALHLQR